MTQIKRKDEKSDPDWTLQEYVKLRMIITWCWAQSNSSLSIVPGCLPGPEKTIDFLEACQILPGKSVDTFDFSLGRADLVAGISTCTVWQQVLGTLIQWVDLPSIPSDLSVSVIEPLHIIDMTATLRVQAMVSSPRVTLEFLATPSGLMAERERVQFQIGFIEPATGDHPLRNLSPTNEIGWKAPVVVTLDKSTAACTLSYASVTKTVHCSFDFISKLGVTVFPVVYVEFPVDIVPFRPFYDHLEVEMKVR
ncbi:hypothetical protein R1flu_004950 [Riccia fluitans]|uniref:Uncharacterized protein n=1 Tax=Riccia fluitans TaxID=41844 RepID=A0ABD1YSA3_9MARC